MRQYAYLFLAASALLTACNLKEDDFTPGEPRTRSKALTISATHSSETKTSTQDGGTTVFWETGEQIKVFNAGAAGLFASQNNALSETADFTGELPYTAGDLLTALYPYTEEAVWEGDTLRTTLPAYQAGRKGSFAKNTNFAAAQSKSLKMKFMNVCGGIRFTLSRNDITKVAFQGVGQEALAGDLAIVFEGGVPVVRRVYNEYTRVFTTPEEGETFAAGEWYYLEMAPATLSQGVIVTFYTADNKTGVAKSTNPLTISRSYFMSKENLDSEVEAWEEEETQEMTTQQNSMDIEIPETYNQDYINSLRISNFYGDYDLAADKKGNKIVRRRTPTKSSSSFAYSPLFLNGTYKTAGTGYMFHYLQDKQNKIVMSCISKGDASATMTAKSTAISLLLQTTQLLTSNPDEIEYIARELETLDEFHSFVRQVNAKIEQSMISCQAPDYSTLDRMPVVRALIGRYMQSADAKDGIDLIDQQRDPAKQIISLKVRNHYRRVLHIYGTRAWMDETNLVPVRTENATATSLKEVVRFVLNNAVEKIKASGIIDCDEEDKELAEEVIRNFEQSLLNISLPEIIVPQSANYWKIVGGSAVFWNPSDTSSPFESTSGILNYKLGDADKLLLDVYGLGRLNTSENFTEDDMKRMQYALIHGIVNDFILPLYHLATGSQRKKYDFRYGSNNWPEIALCAKLFKDMPPNTIATVSKKLIDDDYLDALLDVGDYVIHQIGKDPIYLSLLYKCFKKSIGVTTMDKAFREGLKSIFGTVIITVDVSEALTDLVGSLRAAFRSDMRTRFVLDLDQERYITVLSPTKGTALRGKQINFSWETHMGNLVGSLLYGIQLHSSNGSETARHTISRINGTSYQLNLDDIPLSVKGGNFQFRIFAHHPNDSGSEPNGTYPMSEWIPIQMVDYIQPSEAVDLGLSVKWSSSNLGAASATDVGDYYAWGETMAKTSFTWENYSFGHEASQEAMTIYNPTDGLTILLPEHDVVHKVKGGHWRMPTREEWDELYVSCDWQEVKSSEDELLGYNIVSKKNGRMIYLPVTGYMDGTELKDGMRARYWSSSSTLKWGYRVDGYREYARNLNDGCLDGSTTYGDYRYFGMPVRGVYEDSYQEVTQSDIVDLALPSGIKWAGYNLGATKCEELGDYLAWGESDTKESYDWDGYLLGSGASSEQMDKYNPLDGLTYLVRENDAAYQRLGGPYWRMPTIDEWEELKTKCIWTEITINGRRGYLVKSPRNGNAIFLPFSGYLDGTQLKDGMRPRYWSSSSTLKWGYRVDGYREYARNLNDGCLDGSTTYGDYRYFGMPVRAVYDESARKINLTKGEFVNMGMDSVDWATCNMGTSLEEEIGNYFAWGETTAKTSFTWENYQFGHEASQEAMTRYNPGDALTLLLREDDAVYTQYGSRYRIPTMDEWNELWNICEKKEIIINGRRGTLLTSKVNGNTLFLPYSGYFDGTQLKDGMRPRYWSSSSTLKWGYRVDGYREYARNLNDGCLDGSTTYGDYRYFGMPVRAVKVKNEVTVTPASVVDLALPSGIKWAGINMGASSPEDLGGYYAWGETTTKTSYTWENYSFGHEASQEAMTVYNPTDGLTILLPEHDVVHKRNGGHWRMPTMEEWSELQDNCDWELATMNNVRGYKISSRKNNNSVFLPIGGFLDGTQLKDGMRPRYWSSSSTLKWGYRVDGYREYARNLNDGCLDGSTTYGDYRYFGMPVRGVYDDRVEIQLTQGDYIDMGVSVRWARCNVGTDKPYKAGGYFAWGEVTARTNFSWANYVYGSGPSTEEMEKYNSEDGLTILELSDDAAWCNSGGAQRMPTIEEWQELFAHSTRKEYIYRGHAGQLLTSTVNGNTLFFPYSGYLDGTQLKDGMRPRYWSSSSTLKWGYRVDGYREYARNLNDGCLDGSTTYGDYRYFGMPIRGVKD